MSLFEQSFRYIRLFLSGDSEINIMVRHWPIIQATRNHSYAKTVRVALGGLELGKASPKSEMDITRLKIALPASDKAEAKLEIINKMQDIGYQWVPSMHLFEKIKGKVFCFVN